MSEIVRLYKYKELLLGKRAVTRQELMEKLEISEATFKRDLAKLRDQLHVPIEYDRDQGGYVMRQGHTDSELPGLWFSPEEVLSLVTIQQLMTQLEPGLLGPKLKPLQGRLAELMEQHGLASKDISRHIRIVHAGKRQMEMESFEAVAAATMARKRIKIAHFSRQTGKVTEREVSPQRLVHYRDNWYLDAWCHMRDDVRSFSIDAIQRVSLLDSTAKEISAKTIDQSVGRDTGSLAAVPKLGQSCASRPNVRDGCRKSDGIRSNTVKLWPTVATYWKFPTQMNVNWWAICCDMERISRYLNQPNCVRR